MVVMMKTYSKVPPHLAEILCRIVEQSTEDGQELFLEKKGERNGQVSSGCIDRSEAARTPTLTSLRSTNCMIVVRRYS